MMLQLIEKKESKFHSEHRKKTYGTMNKEINGITNEANNMMI